MDIVFPPSCGLWLKFLRGQNHFLCASSARYLTCFENHVWQKPKVYLLTVLKGLKHRLAAGVKLPNLNILLPLEKTQIQTPRGEKTIKLAGRVSQAVAALLRRLGLPYQGNESHGKIRINGVVVRKWFQPKLDSPFSGKPTDLSSSQRRLGKGITHQQRNIRTGNWSLDQ